MGRRAQGPTIRDAMEVLSCIDALMEQGRFRYRGSVLQGAQNLEQAIGSFRDHGDFLTPEQIPLLGDLKQVIRNPDQPYPIARIRRAATAK